MATRHPAAPAEGQIHPRSFFTARRLLFPLQLRTTPAPPVPAGREGGEGGGRKPASRPCGGPEGQRRLPLSPRGGALSGGERGGGERAVGGASAALPSCGPDDSETPPLGSADECQAEPGPEGAQGGRGTGRDSPHLPSPREGSGPRSTAGSDQGLPSLLRARTPLMAAANTALHDPRRECAGAGLRNRMWRQVQDCL